MPRVLPSEETKEEEAARSPTTPPVAAVAGSTPGGSKRPRTAEEKAIAARLGESRAGWYLILYLRGQYFCPRSPVKWSKFPFSSAITLDLVF